jgi:NAD(P)-dependent dehydrogenase (short-subunit alcohol dehydrogenase family)
MDSFEGARVVVTGGASGIGFGLATALVERGANAIALADIETDAVRMAAAELSASSGAEVVGITCDVTDPTSVEAMAHEARSVLGGVDVVCLNAGVFAGGHAWETTDDDWDWVTSVNLRGVVNGLRSFVPAMIESGTPAHVLVTASIAGVVAAPTSAVYCTSKFAAVGLSESLHHDLALVGAGHVAVSVVCPGMVRTNIDRGDRNRPAHLGDVTYSDATVLAAAGIDDALAKGIDPIEGARNAIGQVLDGRFYVSTQPVDFWERLVGAENEDRLAGRPPRFQMYE